MKLGPKEPYDPNNPEHNDPQKYVLEPGSVFDHILYALRSSGTKDPLINLGILLHDVGKPETYSLDAEGKHRYFGHAQAADKIIDIIADRFHLDNDVKKKIQFAAINHMKIGELLKMSNSKIAELMNNDAFDILMKVSEADLRARGKMFDEKEWKAITDKIAELTEKFKDRKAIEAIKKVVNGNWVMKLTGLTQKDGPKIGQTINTVVGWILDNNIDIKEIDKIAEYIKGLKK